MPLLVIDMYLKENGPSTGKLIIDRHNILFVSHKDQPRAFEIRDFISDFIDMHRAFLLSQGLKIVSTNKIFAMTEDPRHDVLGHVSEYDRRQTAHRHITLEESVTLRDMEIIFALLDKGGLDAVMSPECRKDALAVIRMHFQALGTKAGIEAELEYKHQKDNDLKDASNQVTRSSFAEQKDIDSDSDFDDLSLLSLLSFQQARMNQSMIIRGADGSMYLLVMEDSHSHSHRNQMQSSSAALFASLLGGAPRLSHTVDASSSTMTGTMTSSRQSYGRSQRGGEASASGMSLADSRTPLLSESRHTLAAATARQRQAAAASSTVVADSDQENTSKCPCVIL